MTGRFSRAKAGFTLLEVVIALAILATSVMILVETQAGALFMSNDARNLQVATMLAEEKMAEAQLTLEREGWSSQDIDEEGDFEGFGSEDFRGDDLRLEMDEDLADFHWAYTIRKIELTIPTDLGGMAGDLAGTGYFGEEGSTAVSESDSSQMDLSALGITPEMITEYLGDYIREVRVLVWWGENEDGADQVELLMHAVNPSGVVTTAEDEETTEETTQ